ncbi:MAG TPA: ATP-binding protein [Nitrospirota bacterium]|nr:ATP-binding protein [Nitrospirota bacterium]
MSQKKMEHKVLFIEDSQEKCERIRSAFAKVGGNEIIDCVPSSEAAFEVIRHKAVDALFVNPAEHDLVTAEFMEKLTQTARQVPVIIMLPRLDDDTVLRMLQAGAFECVAADSLDSYPAAARRAITRFKTVRYNVEQTEYLLYNPKQWMSIIDAITDYIFVLNSAQTLVKVNHAFAEAIGRHPREIVGNRLSDVFDLDVSSESTHSAVLGDGTPRTYEKKIGDDFYQISVFPWLEDDRPLTIHVIKNITEVRRLKDLLYHAEKLASLGLLVSGVAHELNNPLTGTIAYTELLSMKVTDESIKAELKKILGSAERCKKIVDNLLTFSRQRTPSKSLESINDIIDRAIDLRSYWLKLNHIQIVREYDPVSTVFVDAQQIQQVMLNLLLNAEQAIVGTGQTKGVITFRTRLNKEARRVSIQVIDSGPGVPPKVASKIFDPFFTTKSVDVGAGLGLSISHGIITEHGGTIQFHNAEGGGAVFTIELPTGTDAPPGASSYKKSGQVG